MNAEIVKVRTKAELLLAFARRHRRPAVSPGTVRGRAVANPPASAKAPGQSTPG